MPTKSVSGLGLQSAGDDGPVLSLHAHDVGHGADGGQSRRTREEGVLPVLAAQGQHQLEGHAHACQMLERIRTVLPVGVHHRHGGGELLLALMMVRYHHVHSQRGGVGHLLIAGDAAVHGDHEGHP